MSWLAEVWQSDVYFQSLTETSFVRREYPRDHTKEGTTGDHR